MADNTIYVPLINPMKFVNVARTNLAQYFTKQFDQYLFYEQLYDFEEKVNYFQRIFKGDTISLQFSSNFSPIQIDVINKYGNSVLTFVALQVRRNTYDPDYYIYEAVINTSALEEGCYSMQVTAGTTQPILLISEIFIITTDITNTLYFEYSNSVYHEDVLFETGIKFSMRVPGIIAGYTPGAKDVIYEDQILNNTLLSSRAYRNFKLFIGNSEGIPDWIIDKLNRVLSCDRVSIDGKLFCKADGAKWEEKPEENYAMAGWTIDLRESINRYSLIYQVGTIDANKKLLVVHNVESKGFGDVSGNGNNNVVPIVELE